MRVNLKRYWLGALLLASLSLLLFGCGDFGSSQPNVATKTVSGVVSDPSTGLPMPGVTVTAYALAADGTTTPLSVNPASVTSGSDGSYSLKIPASYQGAVVVKSTASLAKRAKAVFASTIGGNTTTLRAVVPASLLAHGEFPPIMVSLATEALYQYVNVNGAASGGFTEQNVKAAGLILENFFGTNFSTTPPPSGATDAATSKAQQDLLVSIRAVASLSVSGDIPALVLKLTAPLGTLAGDIKNSIQTVIITLKADGTLPNEYVPNATIITGISNAGVAALQVDPSVLSDTTAPAFPPAIISSSFGARIVVLNWNDLNDPDVDGYAICRASGNTDVFVSVGSVPAGTTSFTDLTVAPQTRYSYKVIAFDKARNFSASSNVVTVTTLTSLDTIAPAPPTSLVRIAGTATQNKLQWKQAIKTAADGTLIPASRYYVYRDGVLVTPNGVTATTYGDTGLQPLTQYTYFVKAADANGNISGASNIVTVRTATASSDAAPAYAAGLVQDPANPPTATSASLKWNTVTATGATYNVYQDGVLIASGLLPASGATTVTFTDGSVLPNSTYNYQVSYTFTTAAGLRLESQLSAAVPVTTPAGSGASGAPSVPTNLKAGIPTSTSVALTWTASTPASGDSFVAYEIYRKNMTTAEVLKIATVMFPATVGVQPAYVDTAVTPGSTYGYWLKAVGSGGARSAASDMFISLPIPAAVTLNPNPPSTPTALVNATGSAAASYSVSLSWTASPESDVAGYYVYRDGVQIADVTGTSFTDNAVQAATTYRYAVAAYNTSGNVSAATAALSVTTGAANGFYLYGRVTINGEGLAGITVTSTSATDGSTVTATTDANGSYSISGLLNNTSYTVASSIAGDAYVFVPASKTVVIHGANIGGLDFIASIPGIVSGGVTFPDGTIIGGVSYPPGSVINGVTYPTGATVINGVVYPTGTVLGGVAYPNGTVIGGVTMPNGTVVGGITLPSGSIVGGIAFPVGYDASGFATLNLVNVGTQYPTGVIAGGVYYPTGTVQAGAIYYNGSVIGQVTYPTGTVVGSLYFTP